VHAGLYHAARLVDRRVQRRFNLYLNHTGRRLGQLGRLLEGELPGWTAEVEPLGSPGTPGWNPQPHPAGVPAPTRRPLPAGLKPGAIQPAGALPTISSGLTQASNSAAVT
jgi:hypothetical protein